MTLSPDQNKRSMQDYLDRLVWLCVMTGCALIPSLFYRGSLNTFEVPKKAALIVLLTLAYGIVVATRFRGLKDSLSRNRVIVALIVAFLALNLLSNAFSIHPETSWKGNFSRQNGTSTLILFVLWYFLIRLTSDTYSKRISLLLAFILGSILPVICGILQFTGIDPTSWIPVDERIRPHGTMSFVNLFSGYLSMTIPLCFFVALLMKGRLIRLILIIISTLSTFMILSTYSRGAWISLALAFLLFLCLIFIFRQQRFLLQRKTTIGLFVLGMFFSALVFGSSLQSAKKTESVSDDLEAVTQRTVAERLASSLDLGELTVAGRLRMWKIGFEIIKEYPVWGSGPETFVYLYPKYRTMGDMELFGRRAVLENLHNEIIHMAANTGLPATAVFLAIFLLHLAAGLRAASRTAAPGEDHEKCASSFEQTPGRVAEPHARRCLPAPGEAHEKYASSFEQAPGRMAEPHARRCLPAMKEKILYLGLVALLTAGFVRSLVNVNSISNNILLWTLLAMSAVAVGKKHDTMSKRGLLLLPWLLVAVLIVNAASLKPFMASVAGQKARASLTESDPGDALDLYRRAIILDPTEELYLQQLASVHISLFKEGKDQEEHMARSLSLFNTLIQDNPLNFQYRLARGRAYAVFGDEIDPSAYEKAIEDFRKALEMAPYQAEVHGYIAQVLIRQNKLTDAQKAIQRAIDLYPKNIFHRQTLGNIYMTEGRYLDAVEQFSKIIKLDSRDAAAYNNLGVALVHLNELGKAEDAFRESLSHSPGNEEARKNLNRLLGESSVPGVSKKDDFNEILE